MSAEIEKRRRQIDQIDLRLVELIARRARLAREIGRQKRRLRIRLSDSGREREVIVQMRKKARALGIEPNFISLIAKKIIAYCKREQRK